MLSLSYRVSWLTPQVPGGGVFVPPRGALRFCGPSDGDGGVISGGGIVRRML
jgi:hypothetical protein